MLAGIPNPSFWPLVGKVVPGGLLVFFPSYSAMHSCLQFWRKTQGNQQIWQELSKEKRIAVESKETVDLRDLLEEHQVRLVTLLLDWIRFSSSKQRNVKAGGSLFFAVCRGRVSEGIDFADDLGRAAIIVGRNCTSSFGLVFTHR